MSKRTATKLYDLADRLYAFDLLKPEPKALAEAARLIESLANAYDLKEDKA